MAEYHLFELLYDNFVDLSEFAPILSVSQIACALICLRKDGCSSFFYHADEKSCVPTLTRYFNTTLLDYQSGYQYFIIRPDCKQDWEVFNGRCYYFEYENMRFANAQANCIEKGGNLAQTDSPAENSFFITVSQRGDFWIGGKKVEGIWTWLDGSPFTTDYWAPLQPSGGTNCVQQWKNQKGHDDDSCSVSRYSLCEK